MSGNLLIGLFVAVTLLFFWGVYKALRTRRVVYMTAMVPMFAFILWFMIAGV